MVQREASIGSFEGVSRRGDSEAERLWAASGKASTGGFQGWFPRVAIEEKKNVGSL